MRFPLRYWLPACVLLVFVVFAAPVAAQDDGLGDEDTEFAGEEEEQQEEEQDRIVPGSLGRPFENAPDQQSTRPEFHPTYRLRYGHDLDVSKWDHDFRMNYQVTERLRFNASSLITLKENDVLKRMNRRETWNAGLSFGVTDAIDMGVKLNRNRQVDVRNEGKPNEVRSFRDRETVNLTTSYAKTHLSGLETSLSVSAGLEKNEYADVRSEGSTQSIDGGIKITPIDDLSAEFGYTGNHSILDTKQGALQSTDESIDHRMSGILKYAWGGHSIDVSLRRSMSEKDYPKLQQTEHREQESEDAGVSGNFALVPGLQAKISYDFSRDRSFYEIETTRDSDLKSRVVDARLSYELAETNMSVELRSGTDRNEYFSTQSGNTYSKSFAATISRSFGNRLSARLVGRTSLHSHHFDDIEANDQDRDLFAEEVNLTVNYNPRSDLSTSLNVSVKEDQLIYIRTSRSGDSKTTQTYRVRPNFSKTFGNGVTLGQIYELSADYTFYRYNRDSNFLIRNFAVTTSVDWPIRGSLKLSADHKYRAQDEGSYVEDEYGVERYGRNSERDEQTLGVTVSYKLAGLIDIEVNQTFGVQEKWRVEDGARNLSWTRHDTSITGKAGLEYTLRDGTTVSASVSKTSRDATRIAESQREVWRASVTINRTFF